MKYILGKKINMTQVWDDKGHVVPITIIEAGPCVVSQIRTKEKDGYTAVQMGFGKKRNPTKPMKGHMKDITPAQWLRECRMTGTDCKIGDKEVKRGDILDVGQFQSGDMVKVSGVSKGKGFQGVVKRHGFHGHPATHGHKDQLRMPGAIGAGGMQHVRKGQRMAGRMGGEHVSAAFLKVVSVDAEHNRLSVRGAVPGARGSMLIITSK